MNELTIINYEGTLAAESREVAEMVEKNHKELLQDIRGYAETLDAQQSANLRSSNFFIEST